MLMNVSIYSSANAGMSMFSSSCRYVSYKIAPASPTPEGIKKCPAEIVTEWYLALLYAVFMSIIQ